MCPHSPPCPAASDLDHEAARTVISHPEQGWSLLCNGIVVFEDTGELLPGGAVVAPHRPTDIVMSVPVIRGPVVSSTVVTSTVISNTVMSKTVSNTVVSSTVANGPVTRNPVTRNPVTGNPVVGNPVVTGPVVPGPVTPAVPASPAA